MEWAKSMFLFSVSPIMPKFPSLGCGFSTRCPSLKPHLNETELPSISGNPYCNSIGSQIYYFVFAYPGAHSLILEYYMAGIPSWP